MSGYSCEFLNNQITFYPNCIDTCCSGFTSPRLLEIKDGKIDFDLIINNKRKFIDNFKNGNPLPKCLQCYNLAEYDASLPVSKFSSIWVNHFTCCNCACIYCVRDFYLDKKEKQSKPKYELLPIIQEMYKRDLISKEHLNVEFQGGDIGCLKEFTNLIKLFEKNSNTEYVINTNNIVYHPVLEKLFSENRVKMSVALDAGSRESYYKIKRVDKFNKVIENLKRYIKHSKNPPYIMAKYIILKGINDNLKEIFSFINVIRDIGIKHIVVSIDYNDIMNLLPGENKNFKIESHYYKLIPAFIEEAKKNGLGIGIDGYSKMIYDKCQTEN